jgi:hypothetical protein
MAKSKRSSKEQAREARESFVERSRALKPTSDATLRGKVPDDILAKYEVKEWKHAAAILAKDFPSEARELFDVLRGVKLLKSHVIEAGGGKTEFARLIDAAFDARGWKKKRFDTRIEVDGASTSSPTHEVDCFKNRIALEVEWSNKDPFFDRDLNNFRLLFDLRVISLGIIITKSDDLAALFQDLGLWSKYGTTTTWMSKLLPRINGGGGGGCPLLVFGITKEIYQEARA